MHKNTVKFIKDLKVICKENSVSLQFSRTKTIKVNEHIRTSGFFCDEPLTLACATKSHDFINTLVHESCHLDQFIEKSNLWTEASIGDVIDEWLAGKNIDRIEECIKPTKYLELDCEKRAVLKIKKYQLPINTSEYIQKANAYLWFHNYMFTKRSWPKPGNGPWEMKQVWSKLPKTFSKNYDVMPKNFIDLYDKHITPTLK